MKALNHKEIKSKFLLFFIAALVFALAVFAVLFLTIDIVPDQIADKEFTEIIAAKNFKTNQSKIVKRIDELNSEILGANTSTKDGIHQHIDELPKLANSDTASNELLKKIVLVLQANLDNKIKCDGSGNASAENDRLKNENSRLQSEKISAESRLLEYQKGHP